MDGADGGCRRAKGEFVLWFPWKVYEQQQHHHHRRSPHLRLLQVADAARHGVMHRSIHQAEHCGGFSLSLVSSETQEGDNAVGGTISIQGTEN